MSVWVCFGIVMAVSAAAGWGHDLRTIETAPQAWERAVATEDAIRLPPAVGIALRRGADGDFLGLGRITIAGVVVRAGDPPLMPVIEGREPYAYRRARLQAVRIDPDGRGATLDVRLTRADDAADRLTIYLRSAALGPWQGFSYSYRFASRAREVHRIADRASWGMGGTAEGLRLLEQTEAYGLQARDIVIGGDTAVAARRPLPHKEAGETWFGVGDYIDYLTAANASLVRFIAEPTLVYKDLWRAPGDAELQTRDTHVTALTRDFRTAPMVVALGDVGGVDGWFQARDLAARRLREQARLWPVAPLPIANPEELPEDIEGELDFYASVGLRRLWVWCVFESNWSEWDTLTAEERSAVKLPLSHAVLRFELSSRHDLERLQRLVRAGHERGIETYLWVPSAHLSPFSPLLREHPDWLQRRRSGEPFNYVYDDLVGVYHPAGFSDYALERLAALRQQAPYDGVWLDSFQVFATDHVNYALPGWPHQFAGVLAYVRRLRDLGLGVMVEGHWPMALPSSTGFVLEPITGKEFLLHNTSPHLVGRQVTPEEYFRLVAFKAPPVMTARTWRENARLQAIGGYVNRAYVNVLPLMERCRLAPDYAASIWTAGDQAAVFAFADGVVTAPAAIIAAQDAVTGEPATAQGRDLRVAAWRVYRVTLSEASE